MEKIKLNGAIFDMDGTIIDSMRYWAELDERFLTERNLPYTSEVSNYLKTCSLRMAAEFFSAEYGIEGSVEEIEKMIVDGMREPYEKFVKAKKGAPELLRHLESRGVSMCIATSTDRELAEIVLQRLDLRRYFVDVISCSDIGKNKDHPDIFYAAMDKMGTSVEETVVFEDSFYAIKTAVKYGFRVAAVADVSAEPERSEITDMADVFVENPGDLIRWF